MEARAIATVAGLITLLGAGPASAARIEVTTTLDDAAQGCTLREAVDTADADASFGGCVRNGGDGADVIALAAGRYELTQPGAGEADNVTGDLDVDSNVTIEGAGAAQTTIDANGLDRAIEFRPGAGNATVSKVRVVEGRAPIGVNVGDDGGDGGAILHDNGTLTILDAVFENNHAGDGAIGGDITSLGGNGGWGGAIRASGQVVVRRSIFTNNRAGAGNDGAFVGGESGRGGTGGSGGAIAAFLGELTLEDATFTDNVAGAGGRGADGAGTTTDGAFGGSGGDGGALVTGSTVTITRSSFLQNSAGTGGPGGNGEPGQATGAGNGGSAGDGGAADFQATGATITGTSFVGNTAGAGGVGGSDNAPSRPAPGAAGGNGGAIDTGDGNVSLTESTLRGNTAGTGGSGGTGGGGTNDSGEGGEGGGVRATNNAGVTLTRSTLADNSAGPGGPAATVNGAAGAGGLGGGLAIDDSSSTAQIVNSTLSGNSGGAGGAGNAFEPPAAGGRAGAIFNDSATTAIRYSTLAGNKGGGPGLGTPAPPVAEGGAILAEPGGGTVTVTMTILAGNGTAACLGAGVLGSNAGSVSFGNPSCPGTEVDPKLGPLASNGGSTQTHALLAGSGALDVAPPAGCPATDQRGTRRPQGRACDAGAFERFVAPATPPKDPPPVCCAPDVTKPKPRLTVARQRLARTLRRGVRVKLRSNEAGSATVRVFVGGKRVARGSVRFTKAARKTVVAKFTRKAKKQLRRKRAIRLVVRVTVTDAARNRGTATRRVRVKR